MYCSKCGCEYRPGNTVCPDCQEYLIDEKPLIVREENVGNGQMKTRLRNHKMGILSFLISLVTVIWVVITSIKDIFFPPAFSIDLGRNAFIMTNILLLINIVGLVVGVISLTKNGYKKTLAIWGITINSILPITSFISLMMALNK